MAEVSLILETEEDEVITRHGDVRVTEVMLEAPNKMIMSGVTYNLKSPVGQVGEPYPVSFRRVTQIIDRLATEGYDLVGTPPIVLSFKGGEPAGFCVYFPESATPTSTLPSS